MTEFISAGFEDRMASVSIGAVFFGSFPLFSDTSHSILGMYKTAFLYRNLLRSGGVLAEASNNCLVLSGTVRSRLYADLAESLAHQMPRVSQIRNNIQVLNRLEKGRDDLWTRVHLALCMDEDFAYEPIEVSSLGDRVVVQGTVSNMENVSRGLDLVRGLIGGGKTEVSLNVFSAAPAARRRMRVDDDSIQAAVLFRLAHTTATADLKVKVRAVEQQVTLQGVAQSREQRKIAESLAKTTLGVRSVINDITCSNRAEVDA